VYTHLKLGDLNGNGMKAISNCFILKHRSHGRKLCLNNGGSQLGVGIRSVLVNFLDGPEEDIQIRDVMLKIVPKEVTGELLKTGD